MINIRKLEAELWESADLLRAGSKLTSNQYCMPVLGLIFLRYAYSRFKMVEAEILKNRPSRGGRVMPVEASDFAAKSALFLPKEAQYDYLLNLPDDIASAGLVNRDGQTMTSLGEVVNNAMALIEEQSDQLTGVIKSGDEANSFYHDAHNLDGCCDYVMANPPFNVDKVKAESCESAKRLPFGMTSVNKNKEVGNGNYLWISFLRKDVGLNKTEKAVLRLLIEDSDRTAHVIAAEIGVTKRTIERTFVSLQKKGKIERIGSKRDGMWGLFNNIVHGLQY